MSLTITLTEQIEARIRRRAARAGLTPEEYVRRRLTTNFRRKHAGKADERAKSLVGNGQTGGAELWSELEAAGVLVGYGDSSIDSPDLARQLSAAFSRGTTLE